MIKHVKPVVGLMMAMVLALSATAFCREVETAQEVTPYNGPKRPFDPKPLMDELRADPARQTGPFTFACVSDREFGIEEFNTVVRRAEQVGFDFCMLVGDIVHRGAGEEGIRDYANLERESGWFLARHPCWPVIGNHEIGKKTAVPGKRPDADGFERWREFYNMPEDWYSFTYRNNLFIVIGLISDLTATEQRRRVEVYPSKHMAWLEEQLKAGQGMDNIFVFQHLPLFSVGIHEDSPEHPMVDLCAKYNVTAVICGHDHNYYRTFRKGVSYLLAAGGGGSLYDLTYTDRAIPGDVYLGGVKTDGGKSRRYRLHSPALYDDKTYDRAPYFFVALTVDGRNVTARAVTAEGDVIDNAILRDAQGKNVPPGSMKTGAGVARESTLQWEEAEGTRIPIPPAEHPRLYLRAGHVEQLPQRLKDPALQEAVSGLQALAKRSTQLKMEWDALQYLVTHDNRLGRSTIEATLPLLRKCELADRQDACRETGRMMVTGAIVYDWCYGLLTPEEKQAFIKELVRLAGTQECGYPPTRQGSVTGHSSEAMIMRDMLSAGIAIYDEFPEMYRLAAGRFFREHLPARNWFYSGHAYHQGDSYGPHRFSWDTYPLWIFDRLGAGNVYNPEQQFIPYLWIYTTRPDGQRLRAGDTFAHSAARGRPWGQYIGTLLTASYYGDGILLDQHQRQGGSGGNETIFDVLWRDTQLQPRSIRTLPLSRYFGSPFGWVVARTGWDEDAVIAEIKVNEYNFTNHQHLDAGAFQIYYKGALAIDSGLYSGSSGAYGSPHCMNYYWRTIAHNSLLVYDPGEDFGRRGYGNDGGQRLPNGRSEPRNLDVLLAPANGYRTGEVLAHGFGPGLQTPDYTLLQGDLTAAYGEKVRQVTRSFVFLNLRNSRVPAAMVVFDRVVSADPAFRKYWLLHTLEEPQVDSASAVVDCTEHGSNGRLTLDVLLPACGTPAPGGGSFPAEGGWATLTKVGGPGKEFWVFGQNYANDVDPQRLERSSMEPGAWRIEVSPTNTAAEDLFLNVMQVTDRRSPSRWPVRRLDARDRTGCVIEGPEATWVLLLRKDSQRSGESVTFRVPGNRPCKVLVTDLAPGRWRVQPGGPAEFRDLTIAEESAAAWFEGPPGTWTLSH